MQTGSIQCISCTSFSFKRFFLSLRTCRNSHYDVMCIVTENHSDTSLSRKCRPKWGLRFVAWIHPSQSKTLQSIKEFKIWQCLLSSSQTFNQLKRLGHGPPLLGRSRTLVATPWLQFSFGVRNNNSTISKYQDTMQISYHDTYFPRHANFVPSGVRYCSQNYELWF